MRKEGGEKRRRRKGRKGREEGSEISLHQVFRKGGGSLRLELSYGLYTLVPENGNKIACFRIQSGRFWQQSRLFPDTKLPVSAYKVAVFGNKCRQAFRLQLA